MKTLTIKDPTPDVARAYIAGVLHGDGWLTARTLGLWVADQDFAESSSGLLEMACAR